MPWVYMLQCRGGSYYVGSTRNLQQRLLEHQSGLGAEFTKRRLPVELVWAEEVDSIGEAFALEKQIQGWSRAKRQALIDHRWADLPGLSRNAFKRSLQDQEGDSSGEPARPADFD